MFFYSEKLVGYHYFIDSFKTSALLILEMQCRILLRFFKFFLNIVLNRIIIDFQLDNYFLKQKFSISIKIKIYFEI